MKEIGFKKGISDGIPIFLGYLSVSFAFGIFSVSSGLTPLEALLISMFNVTSAGQLAAVPIFVSAGSFIELAATQFTINLRYALMSVTLSQKLDSSFKLPQKLITAFMNTDEIFAVASGKQGSVGRHYMLGLALTPYIGWSLGTLLGAVAGNVLPEILVSALGVAMYGMFIAIVVPPSKKSRATALCVLTAIAMSCIMNFVPVFDKIPGGFVIIICAALSSLIFALIAPINDEKEAAEND